MRPDPPQDTPLTHGTCHCGKLSQTLKSAGQPQIDRWRSE